MQRHMLSEYLTNQEEFVKAKNVSKSRIRVVNMKWADKRNIIDSEVYLMRHLETFMAMHQQDGNVDSLLHHADN